MSPRAAAVARMGKTWVPRATRAAVGLAIGRPADRDARDVSPDRFLAGRDLLSLPWLVWLIAAGTLALLLAVAGEYGFHRDEMYFIVSGRHPDWGYVDQPPFTPLLSAASVAVFGLSPLAVRIAPALVTALVVVLTAAMARYLGASRSGQILAALVLAVSGWLGAGHLDETVTFDVLFWTIGIGLLLRLLAPDDGGDHRWRWLALGLVIGIALENKTLAVTLPATVTASLVLLRRWEVFRQPWPWLAALVALAIWLPYLVWQAANGFPQVAMAQSIAASQGPGLDGRIKAIVQLIALAGPLLFPVSIAGAVWLLRSSGSRPWRPLGLAFVLQLALMLLANGKSYYSASFLPVLIAAGAIPLDGWLRRGRLRLRRPAFALATVTSGVFVALPVLPIVPVAALHATPVPSIYEESVAQVGWRELAAQVESVAASMPAMERSKAVVVTSDYGQYSALTLLGADLPPVYSGHNSTWHWGRPPDGAAPVILVAFEPAGASPYFADCRVAATIDNGLDLPTQEQGRPIWICGSPLQAWPDLWPQLRHID